MDEWKKWFRSAKPFARGAYALVFKKKETHYPKGFFYNRGNIVKVVKLAQPEAKAFFWEMKIIHALFPENTPVVRTVRLGFPVEAQRFGPPRYSHIVEIHMDQVSAHRALQRYQRMFSQFGEVPLRHRISTMEYQMLANRNMAHSDVIKQLSKKMLDAGIDSHYIENQTNVSLANPKKPVFFEPTILNINRLKEYITIIDVPFSQKKKLFRWIERWELYRTRWGS